MISEAPAITERQIAEAEAAANEAESRYTGHELACTNYRRDLTCLRCQQLWAEAREAGRHWESLIAERVRQEGGIPMRRGDGGGY